MVRFLALGINSVASAPLGDGEAGAIHIIPAGASGLAQLDWLSFLGWIEQFTNCGALADVRSKLAMTGADERHVFIGVSLTTPWEVLYPLHREITDLPSGPPLLPAEITHLWIWGTQLPDRCLAWFPDRGWFDPSRRRYHTQRASAPRRSNPGTRPGQYRLPQPRRLQPGRLRQRSSWLPTYGLRQPTSYQELRHIHRRAAPTRNRTIVTEPTPHPQQQDKQPQFTLNLRAVSPRDVWWTRRRPAPSLTSAARTTARRVLVHQHYQPTTPLPLHRLPIHPPQWLHTVTTLPTQPVAA